MVHLRVDYIHDGLETLRAVAFLDLHEARLLEQPTFEELSFVLPLAQFSSHGS